METAVRDGVKESAPMAIAKNLMEMLVPFVKESVGEINLLHSCTLWKNNRLATTTALVYDLYFFLSIVCMWSAVAVV